MTGFELPIFENDYLRLKPCRNGWLMYNNNDYIGTFLDIYGEWAQPELDLLDQFITFGDTVLDVGANIGTHTLFFAKKTLPSGQVLAFEPQRHIHQMLCGNIALNALQNVFTFQSAVGAKKGSVTVPALDPHIAYNFGTLSLGDHQHGDNVPIITIDSLTLNRCDLIKIDVEGAEIEVLKGAKTAIKKFLPIIYVENNNLPNSEMLIKTLLKYGYHCWWHIYERFNPNNFFGIRENVLDPPTSIECNMLCLPKSFDISDYDLNGLHNVLGTDDTWEKAWKRIKKA